MRLLFVNHCHPETPHVCGTRAARFAEACAGAGAQVVLLTQTLEDRPAEHRPQDLAARLAAHDWSRPFLLACEPRPDPLLERFRDGTLPVVARKGLAAAYYLAMGGVFTDWRAGSRPYWPVLAETFRPRAVWASFGNTDALAIGRAVARRSRCPWVMDVKDPWSVFIPGPVRALTARRFNDAAAVTALSPDHARDAARWFSKPATVVYSGIGEDLLTQDMPDRPPGGPHRLLLMGGLYGQAGLEALLAGIEQWRLARHPDAVELVYAGGEQARILETAARVAPGLPVEALGYLSLGRIRELAAGCRATLYVRAPRALFQHKLFELVSLARPILCLPPECDDARALAAELGARLFDCAQPGDVAAALDACPAACPPDRQALARYGWDAQARVLMNVFRGVA